jgi:hypothetical protein
MSKNCYAICTVLICSHRHICIHCNQPTHTALYCPQTTVKSLRWDRCYGAVQGECLLPGGLKKLLLAERKCNTPETYTCRTNAFKMTNSNSSLIAKSCAYIEFLAGFSSWFVDCSYLGLIPRGMRWKDREGCDSSAYNSKVTNAYNLHSPETSSYGTKAYDI